MFRLLTLLIALLIFVSTNATSEERTGYVRRKVDLDFNDEEDEFEFRFIKDEKRRHRTNNGNPGEIIIPGTAPASTDW